MKMHKLLKDKGLEVKVATPKNDDFELKESGFIGLNPEDLKIIEGVLKYKRLQDKLQSLKSILEDWADKHDLAKKVVTIRLGAVWMAFAQDNAKKVYNQPNLYISFSDRLTGKLHVEVGLHFRNVKGADEFSKKAIEQMCNRKTDLISLVRSQSELGDLELFLASGRLYRKVQNIKLSELQEEHLEKFREAYDKNKDVRVMFIKIYEPQQIIALGDKFSEEVAHNFASLYDIFNFLDVKP